jgi:hypothetical protein
MFQATLFCSRTHYQDLPQYQKLRRIDPRVIACDHFGYCDVAFATRSLIRPTIAETATLGAAEARPATKGNRRPDTERPISECLTNIFQRK